MEAYQELIEPSKISNCLGCNFISPTTKHLIVGKTSILQVYEIISHDKSYKLNLVNQFKLFGTITDLKAIRTIENPALDYLLVSTKFAKLSLIKWNHKLNTIQTVSLHYYENIIQNSTFDKISSSSLIIDPNCLCLRFKNLLTFLPFNKIGDIYDDVQTQSKEIFDSSFLINGQNLDSRIGTIIDANFLHNYRTPTIGILYSNDEVWAGNLYFKRDNVSYMVLSLDLATKSSTTVLNIDNLPYDIDRLYPLPKPLNGSLLVGSNQVFHVDNGGIIRKIDVNPFTALTTHHYKGYQDYTSLNLKLEHCSVLPINNKVLIITTFGDFYIINFEMDGKSVKKLTLELVENDIQLTYPNEIAQLDDNLLFLGNSNGNSPLVQYQTESDLKKEKEKEQQDKEDDEDDLYTDEAKEGASNDKLSFSFCDELVNHGPISSFTYGHYSNERFKSNLINPNYGEISIFTNSGSHKQSHLNIFTPSVQPIIKSSLTFSTINKLWVSNNYLITCDDKNKKSEIFQIDKNFSRVKAKDFINNDLSIAIHELNNGKFILQITPKKIVIYNNKFKKKMTLNKILGEEDEIFNSYCNDEILMIFLTNGDVKIIAINTYNDTFNNISVPKILSDTVITTGYVTNSNILNAVTKDVNLLIKKRKTTTKTEGSLGPKQKVFILVTGDNRIVLFNRFHNERCYQLNDVDKFTDELTLSFFENRDAYPDPFIKQVIFNDLGNDIAKSQYITILTMGGEVLLYKLYFDGENFKFLKEKDLYITGAPHNSFNVATKVEKKLFYIENLNGLTGIFVSGDIPYFIVKTNHSIPRIFKFTKIPIMSFGKFNDNQLIFLDDKKNTRICEIPTDFHYENTWPLKRISFDETIKDLTFHEQSSTFILSTYKEIPYNCIDEEDTPIVGTMADKPGALSYKGSVKLISPMTWTVIDEIELKEDEVGMKVESMILDVGTSNRSYKSKREFVVIGTGQFRMEDLEANGAFKLLEIIDIIPEPGKPETNHKFKEFYKEETKGAITSITEISGRFLVSQGQKIIIRDLQDDGVVPVAFLDCSVYVSESKSFGNFVLLGDTLKSVWLVGFDAEPFRMIMLGKDLKTVDVSCADFIVKDEEVYILVGDANNILHVLKYDPEDPNSSNGQRLVEKASFNMNGNISCLKQLPKDDSTTSCIGTTVEGSIFTVFPINEASYRRMYILQQQLTDKEYHHCGMNPRLNRFGGLKFTSNDGNNKPILDYEVIKLYGKLNDDRKRNFAAKISKDSGDIWKDLIEFEHNMNL